MANITDQYDKDCGCKKCSTWATCRKYSCGCVTVEIHEDSKRCDECTDFSGKKKYCGQPGHPKNHN